MHAYMHFMTRVISLSEEAYNDLKSLKSKDESFSDIVRALANNAKSKRILELAGAWSDAPEMDNLFKNILEERHKTTERKLKF